MKQIKDITLSEIKKGLNWKITLPENPDAPLEDCSIELVDKFEPTDLIGYSAISVTDEGAITLLIQIKEVQDLDYGGDYCVLRDGKWEQMGLKPNPNISASTDYVANPLDIDPSFDADWEHRAWHRENFKKLIDKV